MHASAWVAESVSSNIFCVGLCCLFTFHSIAPDPPSTTPPTATPIVVSHTFSITAAFFIWIIILWEKTLQRALAEHHSMNKQKASWRIRIYYMHTHTYICISGGLGSRETVSDGKLFSTFNMTRMKRSTAEWRRCWCRWRRQCQRRTSCDIRRTTYGMQYMVVAWRGMTYRNIHPYINMYTIRIILFPIDSNFNPHKFSLSILKSNCLK